MLTQINIKKIKTKKKKKCDTNKKESRDFQFNYFKTYVVAWVMANKQLFNDALIFQYQILN